MTRTKKTRGKRGAKRVPHDLVPSGGVFSQASSLAQLSVSPPGSPHSGPDRSQPVAAVSQMDGSGASFEARTLPVSFSLGQNRLVTGFRSGAQNAEISEDTLGPQEESASAGDTHLHAIEISDDDADISEEGGMVLNLDKGKETTGASHSRAMDDSPSGTQSDADVGVQTLQETFRRSSMLDVQSSTQHQTSAQTSTIRLKDLNPDELEHQLKYAYYHLERHRIDLDRPVICLACFNEGHLSPQCLALSCGNCNETHLTRLCPRQTRCTRCRERGHNAAECKGELRNTTIPCDLCHCLGHIEEDCTQRFFPSVRSGSEASVKLWISCCLCGSKNHYVGDCPSVQDVSRASRWSLRDLDPTQIINLSLEGGTRRMEVQAENRNMRPEGLKIKGRAGLHHAGEASTGQAHDDDAFLGPPVKARKMAAAPSIRLGSTDSYKPSQRDQASRYDRFNPPPPESSDRRARNDWYSTDSFGRPRSRSPSFRRQEDDSRARDGGRSNDTRRPPPPPASDQYRPAYGPPRRDMQDRQPTRAGWNSWRPEQQRNTDDRQFDFLRHGFDFNSEVDAPEPQRHPLEMLQDPDRRTVIDPMDLDIEAGATYKATNHVHTHHPNMGQSILESDGAEEAVFTRLGGKRPGIAGLEKDNHSFQPSPQDVKTADLKASHRLSQPKEAVVKTDVYTFIDKNGDETTDRKMQSDRMRLSNKDRHIVNYVLVLNQHRKAQAVAPVQVSLRHITRNGQTTSLELFTTDLALDDIRHVSAKLRKSARLWDLANRRKGDRALREKVIKDIKIEVGEVKRQLNHNQHVDVDFGHGEKGSAAISGSDVSVVKAISNTTSPRGARSVTLRNGRQVFLGDSTPAQSMTNSQSPQTGTKTYVLVDQFGNKTDSSAIYKDGLILSYGQDLVVDYMIVLNQFRKEQGVEPFELTFECSSTGRARVQTRQSSSKHKLILKDRALNTSAPVDTFLEKKAKNWADASDEERQKMRADIMVEVETAKTFSSIKVTGGCDTVQTEGYAFPW